MNTNSWFRMYAEFSHDIKIQMMSESYQRRFVMLMCMKCNAPVTLHVTKNFSDDEIAFNLRISLDEWMLTKATFIQKGFIDCNNKIMNWDKRQFISDSSNTRVKRHRERKKQERNKANETVMSNVTCNVTVTPPDTDTDTDNKQTTNVVCTPKREKKTKFDFRDFVLPDFIDREMWNGWMEVRKRKRGAMTEFALSEHLKTLLSCKDNGIDPNAALVIARKREWTGIEVEWVKNLIGKSENGANHAIHVTTSKKLSLAEQAEQQCRIADQLEREQRCNDARLVNGDIDDFSVIPILATHGGAVRSSMDIQHG